jgi:putative oxidoreductase
MGKAQLAASKTDPRRATTTSSTLNWERLSVLYARIALGAAFLSGIASRFGLYGKNVGYGSFANFVKYTAEVNSFMPAFTILFPAWSATAAELVLGISLILGVWLRWAAVGSAVLLALFGITMAISFGIKSPLDYSVFSASAAAVFLALYEGRTHGHES